MEFAESILLAQIFQTIALASHFFPRFSIEYSLPLWRTFSIKRSYSQPLLSSISFLHMRREGIKQARGGSKPLAKLPLGNKDCQSEPHGLFFEVLLGHYGTESMEMLFSRLKSLKHKY
jgi:hypothetical protein